ncbi:MAG TPA: ABC transporter permease [Burkholderiaceae bacterium]|jgi:simple sugar transport system permease protein
MLRLETRPQPSKVMSLASPLIALAVTVVIGVLLFMLLGKDPLSGLRMFFVEPVKNLYGLAELSVKATPLILIALGLAVCYRANVWNIGAEGQYIFGALGAGWVAMQAGPGTAWMGHGYVVLILLAGVIAGTFWGGVVAWLRDRFNANEILVSLMLVYVATYLLSWLVSGPWQDPNGHGFPQTINFIAQTKLPRLVPGLRAHIGLVVALVAVACFWVFMFRTYRGFALQVGGLAPAAARYAGFSARGALWTSLLLSGAMAGLAGALETAGPLGQLTTFVPVGYGFAAIIVAYVGRLHPVGIIFSGFLMSMFYIGGELAQSRLGLPKALTGVFQGLLLFALLACDTLIFYRVRWKHAPAALPSPAPAATVVVKEA